MHAGCMPDDDYVQMVEQENKLLRIVFANMAIVGQSVNFQIDSGATANVLLESDYVRVTDDSKLVRLQHIYYVQQRILGQRDSAFWI